MFGYVRIRKAELKIKDYETYHGFYCGLCNILKKEYGFLGQMTLTYDMTFLVVLLSSVYDVAPERNMRHCIVHPAKKHLQLTNEMSEYAASLNMILTYYHLKDDREDEGSKKAWAGMKLYQGKMKRAVAKYARQEKVIKEELARLTVLEKADETDVLKIADCFGKLMAAFFVYKQDFLAETMEKLGYHLGRFIYIMDAYDDLEDDIKKDCFNPLKSIKDDSEFDTKIEKLLFEEMSEAAAAYQKLPCVEYADILGNILYAGVWNRFDDIQTLKKKKDMEIQEEKNK